MVTDSAYGPPRRSQTNAIMRYVIDHWPPFAPLCRLLLRKMLVFEGVRCGNRLVFLLVVICKNHIRTSGVTSRNTTRDHPRVYRTAAIAGYRQAAAAGSVANGRLPGSVRRPHAAYQHRRLVAHAQGWAEAGRQMELGGAQPAPPGPPGPRHSLRHQM